MKNSKSFHSIESYFNACLANDTSLVKFEDGINLEDINLPNRIIQGTKVLQPNALYNFNGEPAILYFKRDDFSPQFQRKVWCFQSKVVFVETANQITIYNGLALKNGQLEKLKNAHPSDFETLKIKSGEVWEKYNTSISKFKKLDTYLLENIKETIFILEEHYNLDRNDINNLIGRLLFTRYLIDREVQLDTPLITNEKARDDFESLISNKKNLYAFFEYLSSKFNGDLFPVSKSEKKNFNNSSLNIIANLFRGHKIHPSGSQISLFNYYDFSIIPVELISNIYERFIGAEKKKENESFYTPAFLVDYILAKTVVPHLKINKQCKVLDPACGSGIFLVETLRQIISKYSPEELKNDELLKSLVTNNIFGIDKDANAIDIAIFSLYITLLDYKTPKEIASFKFPPLKGRNFIHEDFFNKIAIDKKLKKENFDFIIGNPPWGSKPKKTEWHAQYVDNINKQGSIISDYQIAQSFIFRTSEISGKNTKCALIVTSKILYNLYAKAFRNKLLDVFKIEEVLELSIVRKLIFDGAIGPATILFYSYNPYDNNATNVIKHISLKPNKFFEAFKVLIIEKYDYKEVRQSFLKANHWLWKTLLYGNILDFYFIKRLLNDFESVNDIIKKHNLGYGVGLKMKDGVKMKDVTHLKEHLFLNTKKNELDRFKISPTQFFKSLFLKKNGYHVGNLPKKNVFKGPMVLLRKGTPNNFKFIAAFSDKDLVFTDSVTSIFSSKEKSEVLQNLVGLFNSELFTYFIFSIGSSTGIEREQTFNKDEKFTFPVVITQRISNLVQKIQSIKTVSPKTLERNLFNQEISIFENEKTELEKLENDLNVFLKSEKCYNLSLDENAILNYCLNISIPLFQYGNYKTKRDKIKKQLFSKPKKSDLSKYINIYFNTFKQPLSNDTENFTAEVSQIGKYFTAIHFKIIPEKNFKSKNTITFLKGEQPLSHIESFASLSIQKIVDKIFIQKDIKGIEKDSFYVIKPSEYKNWHPAIAHLDVLEFSNALFRAGKQKLMTLK